MSKVLVNDENLTSIANSIRNKNGSQTTYKPSQMSAAIDSIPVSNKLAKVVDGSVTELTAGDLTGATKIAAYAFDNCASLTSITIPSSATSIGNYAFKSCTVLTTVIIPSSVLTIGNNAFQSCRALSSLTINNGVTTIGAYAFADYNALTSVTFPDSVTTVSQSLFRNNDALTTVIFGSGITTMDNSIFNNCPNFASLTVKATTPPTITGNTFANTPADFNIYVPAASVDTYKARIYWRDRAAYIQAIPE